MIKFISLFQFVLLLFVSFRLSPFFAKKLPHILNIFLLTHCIHIMYTIDEFVSDVLVSFSALFTKVYELQ